MEKNNIGCYNDSVRGLAFTAIIAIPTFLNITLYFVLSQAISIAWLFLLNKI